MLWVMEIVAKMQGLNEPTDELAALTLRAYQLGRFTGCPLSRREVTELSLAAETPLSFNGYWAVHKHHLNDDRFDNRRVNLAPTFECTHRVLSDPIDRRGSHWLRRFHVGAMWHEQLRGIGIDTPWLPASNGVRFEHS